MNKWILYMILLVLACTGTWFKFYKNHQDMPVGCDEFGYMSMARAMNEHRTFAGHVDRPWAAELIDSLKHDSFTQYEIQWLMTPHSYHVDPATGRIINQYPPGTAFMIHPFPVEQRKHAFPPLLIFFMLLIPWIVARRDKAPGWFDLAFLAFAFFTTLSIPFLTEYTRVNSLSFTFGLLIAAGMLMPTRALLSCALIALSSNFRIINMLMLLPLIAFVPVKWSLRKEDLVRLVITGFKYGFTALLCFSPYLIYVGIMLGNPLLPTYTNVDTDANEQLLDYTLFYINIDQPWFVFHLFVIVLLGALASWKRISWPTFFKALAFPVLNYVFFIFHKMRIDYYPYASSVLMLGLAFSAFREFPVSQKQRRWITIGCLLIGVAMTVDGIFTYTHAERKSFEEARSEYTGLCAYDVVWAHQLSGTSEYVCRNNAFKYGSTTSRARKRALQFMHDRNYSQAILLNDNTIGRDTVLNEVQSLGFRYHIINDKHAGDILVIDR